MMEEFDIDDLDGLSEFILDASRKATLEAIAKVADGSYGHTMQVDGYDAPVHMEVKLTIDGDMGLAMKLAAARISRIRQRTLITLS